MVKKVPYAEMRFFFCTHARLYDLPTRRLTLWGRPPCWQLKEEAFGTLYLSVSRLQMIAVNAKNISFDGDLTIAVLKQVLVHNCKMTFRYVAGVESTRFYGRKMSKYSSCTRYKNLLGFFSGRFEKRHQNLSFL